MKFTSLLFVALLVSTTVPALGYDSLRVSLREGTNMAVALSPDKQNLALDLQGTLWILPVSGGKARAITDALGDCRQPSWSPDGNYLVFQSYLDGTWHLWTIHKNGSELRQRTTGIYDDREPHWSPDGKTIVFSSDRNMNYDVWELELETGTVRAMTNSSNNEYFPSYSPDGKRLAFVSERGAKPGIYVRSESGQESLLVNTIGATASAVWSPDGNSLVFYASDSEESRLIEVTVADKKTTFVTTPEEDAFPFKVQWLDPREIIYTADGKIKRRNLATKKTSIIDFEATVSLHRPPYERKKYDFDGATRQPVKGLMTPAVSPDGKKIAFTALGDIYVLSIGNSKPVALTRDSFIDIDPSWSPDSRQLAFVSDRKGPMNVFIYDVATGQLLQASPSPENQSYPMWSPDGKYIAYYATEVDALTGGSVLHRLNLATKSVEKIHIPLFAPSQPSWSPDGKTIAVSALKVFSTRFREGLNKITFISLAGAPDRMMMPVEGRTLSTRGKNGPHWSPDGKWLAYVQDGLLWILPINAQGEAVGPPRRLTNELAESPSWTADSGSIVFLATDTFKKVRMADGSIENIPLELSWQPEPIAGNNRKVIHAGRVFDGITNGYKTNMDIVIEGNRIKEIVPHKANQSGELIDVRDKTVLPGLFEMHAHEYASAGEKLGRIWLSYGITSVREPGGDPHDARERKESWSSGVRTGPRLFTTGGLLDGNRVYYSLANSFSSGADVELEMHRAKQLDYDLVKTYVRMPDYLQQRFTQQAHRLGVPVSSHEIYPAAAYGVDNIEHIGATSRRGYSPLRSALGKSYQDVIELITKSGMQITPTAALYGGFNKLTYLDSSIFKNKQYVALYPADYRKSYEASVRQMQGRMKANNTMVGGFQSTIVKLVAAGSHITAGTDSPIMPYGLSLHLELQTYVDGGLTPFQALQSATIWAAESVGVDKDLGSLVPGKVADLIIVDGDPLKDIRDAWNVRYTIKNGTVYKLEDLLKK
ncbi:MAG: amidohydrolase family protein [Cyclobacteriaceae bacterium]|nr:amidohydrolase family protein [Cyclobacteriaceae bacterium]